MGFVAAAASATLFQGFQMYASSRQIERGQAEARDVLMSMGRDVQRAYQVVEAGHDFLSFYVQIEGELHLLTYSVTNNMLTRYIEGSPPWSVPFSGANIDSFYASLTSSRRMNSELPCPGGVAPGGFHLTAEDNCNGAIYCHFNDLLILHVASSGITPDFNMANRAHRTTAADVYTNRISLNRTPPPAPPTP